MKRPRDIAKLRYWCIRRRGEGVPVNQICTSVQIPRRTFYNWWSQYRLHGPEGLEPRSKAPHTIHRVDSIIAERATALRREKGWGPQLIAGYLGTQDIKVGSTTVYRILCREGLNHPLTKPRTKRTYRRWQRKHPNSLWQCDLKVVGARWLITILDDHSRYVTASEIFKEGTAENVISLLDQAIREYSKPREILTDHGSQFWSVRKVNPTSTRTASNKGSNISSEESANPQPKARSNDGSEPMTKNTQDSSCTGNSSNTTTTKDHTWR